VSRTESAIAAGQGRRERPDYNVEKLASFLLEPHPKMPNMALSPEEAKDISAFIAEQRRK
jgi:hypothetical protein